MNSTPSVAPTLPGGLKHAYRFAFLNALVFQIATGTPLVLYAKSLGASATVLGVLASMMPLLSVFQLPAAQFLPRFGYRKFMMGGWGLRTLMVFALSGTTLLSYADPTTKLCLVLAEIFIFSLLRGISSGAWMPWITELVPEGGRGLYLSREQIATYGGSLCALGISAWTLAWLPDPWRYAAIFLFSAVAGIVSLNSIRQVPDVEAPEKLRSSSQSVPWGTILRHPPFLRLVIFNILWASTAAGAPIFAVAWLRDVAGFAESKILLLSLCGFAGAMVTLPFVAPFLDRRGSKPVLRIMTALGVLVIVGWTALAGKIWPASFALVGGLYAAFGMANANFSVANARLSMATMPVMGRNHFFALFTVISSLFTGLTPVLWGVLIDSLKGFHRQIGGLAVSHFTIYFAVSVLIMIATCVSVSLLHEARPENMTTRDYAILGSLKRLGRLWQR